jgi:hypothetical protein
VWENGEYREVARLSDSGPISWHDVGAVVPVPRGQTTLKLRLSFLADHWRIDRVAVASTARQGVSRAINIAQVTTANGHVETEALENLRDSDERYLQTSPGQRFFARFDVGHAPDAGMSARTFLLASQGYYTEWIRGSWIRNASVSASFVPTDASLITALRKWGSSRESFERRFMSFRVPVH